MASAEVEGPEWELFREALSEMTNMKVHATVLEVLAPLDKLEKLFNEEKRVSTSCITDILDRVCAEMPLPEIELYSRRIRELLDSIFDTQLHYNDRTDAVTTCERIVQLDRIDTALNRFFTDYVDYGMDHLKEDDGDDEDEAKKKKGKRMKMFNIYRKSKGNDGDAKKKEEKEMEKCDKKSKGLKNLDRVTDDIRILLLSLKLYYLSRFSVETLQSCHKDSKKAKEFETFIKELKNSNLIPKENEIKDFEGKTAGKRIWEKIYLAASSGTAWMDTINKDNKECPECEGRISDEIDYAILDFCNHYICAECAKKHFNETHRLCPHCDKYVGFWVSKSTYQEFAKRPDLEYSDDYIPN